MYHKKWVLQLKNMQRKKKTLKVRYVFVLHFLIDFPSLSNKYFFYLRV